MLLQSEKCMCSLCALIHFSQHELTAAAAALLLVTECAVSGFSYAVRVLQRLLLSLCKSVTLIQHSVHTLCSSVRRVVQTAVSCQLCLTSHIGSVLTAFTVTHFLTLVHI
jgi:hypothetical protein